jgi:uncharacterized membrane protein
MSSKRKSASSKLRPFFILTIAFALASVGCTLVLILRIMITNSYRYMYLVGNLFLAWIPYAIAMGMVTLSVKMRSKKRVKPVIIILGILWLIFYPNAPYILTDFIHIIRIPPYLTKEMELITNTAIVWYDIVLNASFAFIGHLIGLVSLVFFHNLTKALFNRWIGWIIAITASLLGGYGIFLGRFVRLHSWHVFTKTIPSMKLILGNLFNAKALLFSFCLGFFIFLTYIVVYAFWKAGDLHRQTYP